MGIAPQVSTCVCDCDSKYKTLKEAYDEMKPKYNTCFVEAQTYREAFKTLEKQKVWFQHNQLAYEDKIRVLSRDLENTSNELKFAEKEKAMIESEKDVLKDKLDKEIALHMNWLILGDNLASHLYGSQAVNSGIGLGFKKICRVRGKE
jgi:predicted  nucleic acid-binding Zn-ribbon protein